GRLLIKVRVLPKHEADIPAIEECSVWRLEQKLHAEAIAVKGHGRLEVADRHTNLPDTGQAQFLGGRRHGNSLSSTTRLTRDWCKPRAQTRQVVHIIPPGRGYLWVRFNVGMKIHTLTIVGVGLIGGSLGLAARRRGLAARVLGVGRQAAS